MRSKHLRFIVALGTFVILGIITVQIYWVTKAFNTQEQQFSFSVESAISNAASDYTRNAEVDQLSSSYYIVCLNGTIDTNLLGSRLNEELSGREIRTPFEFGIYDSSSHKLLFNKSEAYKIGQNQDAKLIQANTGGKLLGVHFPKKDSYIAGSMYIWIFSSFVLLVLVVFFAYSVIVILKQKKLNDVQKDFVNNMTHEFRTPLTTIQVTADTIAKHCSLTEHPELQSFTSIIQQETQRLNNNVERILQMSKSESDKVKLNIEEFDLHALITENADRIRPSLKTGTQIKLDLKAGKAVVSGDRTHAFNVLSNLLDNANKYSQGGSLITVSTENRSDKIIFSVADNGIGIHGSQRDTVFESFYRVPTGNLHNVKGFGLGLSYVKNIVTAHNWKIELKSIENKGSRFTILIPATA
jgi:two-component system, OmpR family, phosphate regulon sensor histidine kinase PhoR